MKSLDTSPTMAWYRVPELWLILFLLGAAVIGSFSLLATAIRSPDAHIVVPNDEPRSSRMPPINRSDITPVARPDAPRSAR